MYTAIEIESDGTAETDDAFKNESGNISLETIKLYLASAPGKPDIDALTNPDTPIDSIIVDATEDDILITTQQYALKTDTEAIKKGIAILKTIAGTDNVILTVPEGSMQEAATIGGKAVMIGSAYPSAHPHLIIKELTGQTIFEGQTPADLGHCILSAEAVASIGNAFDDGQIPVTKALTVVKKTGAAVMVSAVIGTPIANVLKAVGETVSDNERIILGGPMTGAAAYTLDYPVQPDTDAIIVQNSDNIPFVIDNACINCGECVRTCPVNIPINLLVRYLEAGQYEEAADNYDLNLCIECGLCSYVCTAKMPVFQHIKFGKFELARIRAAEAEAEVAEMEAAEAEAESAEAENAS